VKTSIKSLDFEPSLAYSPSPECPRAFQNVTNLPAASRDPVCGAAGRFHWFLAAQFSLLSHLSSLLFDKIRPQANRYFAVKVLDIQKSWTNRGIDNERGIAYLSFNHRY
jgi:hypothetical protein